MTSRNLHSALALSLFALIPALVAAGCADQAQEPQPTPRPLSEQAKAEASEQLVGDVVAGEKPGEVGTEADCVYIQWCNAPGADGTVCRLRSGCSLNNATLNECVADAYAVCGAPVDPWVLYY